MKIYEAYLERDDDEIKYYRKYFRKRPDAVSYLRELLDTILFPEKYGKAIIQLEVY